MNRRVLSLCFTVAVLCSCMTVTASAAENDTVAIELLEFGTVNNSGSNTLVFTDETTFIVPNPDLLRVRSVDMLVTSGGHVLSEAYVILDGVSRALTVQKIDSSTYRIYGTLNGWREELTFKFVSGTSGTNGFTIASCKAYVVSGNVYKADSTTYLQWNTFDNGWKSKTIVQESSATVSGVKADRSSDAFEWQARIDINDWQKFDSLTAWGSVVNGEITSIRASVGMQAVPVEVNFIDIADGNLHGIYSTVSDPMAKYLFSVFVDTSELDRTLSTYNGGVHTPSPMYIYITGIYSEDNGFVYSNQYVSGSVTIADTSNPTWWNRFTSFMTGLFAPKSDSADEFQSEAEEQGDQLDEMNDQLQNVTKPPVEDIETDIDEYVNSSDFANVANEFSQISNNGLVNQMVMVALTVGLVGFILYGKR